MQLAIVQNPHTEDPQHLWDALKGSDFDDVPESGMDGLKAIFMRTDSFLVGEPKNVE